MGTVTDLPVGPDRLDEDQAEADAQDAAGEAADAELAAADEETPNDSDGSVGESDPDGELTDEERAIITAVWEKTEPLPPELFERHRLNLEGIDLHDFELANRIGAAVQRQAAGAKFWFVDWAIAVEAIWGAKFWQFISSDLFPDEKTITNWMGVGRKIPAEYRRDGDRPNLEWSHYRYAAGLPSLEDRIRVLDRAQADKLTANQVQDVVRAMKRGDSLDEAAEEASERELATTGTWSLSFTLDRAHVDWGNQIQEKLQRKLVELCAEAGIEPTKITPSKSGAATAA